MAEAPSTRKVQITVPAADTSVTEWLDLQFSASESVRRLIREAVAREGFVDVANRPVRPPVNPVIVEEMLPDEAPEVSTPKAAPRRSAPKSAPAASEPDDETTPPPAPAKTRRERSAPSSASATIDDLLGL